MVFRRLLRSNDTADRLVSTSAPDDTLLVNQPIKLQISQQSTVRFLSLLLFALVLLHTIGLIDRYIFGDTGWFPEILFDLDTEYNIASYISSLLLLACSLVLLFIGVVKQQQQDRFRRYWQFLAFLFLCLAGDEVLSMHERSIEPLRRFFQTDGFFYFAWVIPAIVLVSLLFLVYLKFLKHLPANTRAGVLLAGAIYLFGSLGVEMVGGWWDDVYEIHTLPYALITTVEEIFELMGKGLFLITLVSYIRTTIGSVHLSFVRQ